MAQKCYARIGETKLADGIRGTHLHPYEDFRLRLLYREIGEAYKDRKIMFAVEFYPTNSHMSGMPGYVVTLENVEERVERKINIIGIEDDTRVKITVKPQRKLGSTCPSDKNLSFDYRYDEKERFAHGHTEYEKCESKMGTIIEAYSNPLYERLNSGGETSRYEILNSKTSENADMDGVRLSMVRLFLDAVNCACTRYVNKLPEVGGADLLVTGSKIKLLKGLENAAFEWYAGMVEPADAKQTGNHIRK